jgi:hypothetical protein
VAHRIYLGGLLVGLLAGPTQAALFSAPLTLTASGGTIGTTVADFDNDEFVGTNGGLLKIYRLTPNTSDWTITSITPSYTRLDRFAGDLAAADMDGDGFVDLIVPNSNNARGKADVTWFKNPGQAGLGAAWAETTISTWSGSGAVNATNYAAHMSEIEVGDLDGDGDIDVVTRDIEFGLSVMVNNGNNTFTRRNIAVNPREGLALFDPNKDGKLDIAINGVWLQTPADLLTGNFTQRHYDSTADDTATDLNQYPSETNTTTIAAYAAKVKVGDMNGDGRDDTIVSNAEELTRVAGRPKGIRVYLAPEDPNQAWTEVILNEASISLSARYSLHTLEIADLDGDGDLDILSAISQVGQDNAAGRIFAMLNAGDGTSYTYESILAGYAYNNVVADANGDGLPDLFGGAHWNSGAVRYFQSVPEPAAAAPLLLGGSLLLRRRGKRL